MIQTAISQWTIYTAILCFIVSVIATRRLHWTLAPFLTVTLLSGAMGPDESYAAYPMLAAIFIFALLPRDSRHKKILFLSLTILHIATALSILIDPNHFGLTGNGSMSACLVAITLPFLLLQKATVNRAIFIVMALTAVLITRASVPLGVLVTVLFTACFRNKRDIPVLLMGVIAALAIGVYSIGGDLFDSNGRFETWKNVFHWWNNSGHRLGGFGVGSGLKLMPVLGISDGLTRFNIWAHNDWLQVLFEQGILGLSSLFLLAMGALVRAYGRPLIFSSVCGFIVCSLFNFPAHLPLTAFVGIALLWLTHAKAR